MGRPDFPGGPFWDSAPHGEFLILASWPHAARSRYTKSTADVCAIDRANNAAPSP